MQLSRRHLPDALDASLGRLQTVYLISTFSISYDPGTPPEEAITAMSQGIDY